MPDDPQAPLPTSGVSTSRTPVAVNAPSSEYLNEQEQQAILQSMGLTGWQIVGGAAQPNIDVKFDNLNRPQAVTSGDYTITVRDPSQPLGQGEKVVIRKGEVNNGVQGWLPVGQTPAAAVKPTTATTPTADNQSYYIKGRGLYLLKDAKNPQAGFDLAVPDSLPNADEEMTKALDRYDRESERAERVANEAAGKGYVSAKDLATINSQGAAAKLGQDTLAQRIKEFGDTQKLADAKQATDDKRATQEILQSKAQTGYIGAQQGSTEATSAKTRQEIGFAEQEQPIRQDQLSATLEATKQSTARTRQEIEQANAPTLEQSQTGMYITKRDPKSGATTQELNPAYVPKTSAEIQARVGQIQSMAQAKQAELNGKISDNYKPEQAYSDFNNWWAQNVAPHEASLKAAQEDADLKRAQDQAAIRTNAYTAANAATTAYTGAFNAENAARVGPRFDEVMNQIGKNKGDWSGIDTSGATTYMAPRPTMAGPAAAAEALKYIDPTAAAQAGAPPPNYAQLSAQAGPMLNRSQYQFGATAPPPPGPPPAAAPAPTPAPPPPEAVPPPGSPGLLPAGVAGVGGYPGQAADPRFAGANPMAGVQMPDWLTGGAPPPPSPAGMPPGPRMPSWSSYGYVPPDYSYS